MHRRERLHSIRCRIHDFQTPEFKHLEKNGNPIQANIKTTQSNSEQNAQFSNAVQQSITLLDHLSCWFTTISEPKFFEGFSRVRKTQKVSTGQFSNRSSRLSKQNMPGDAFDKEVVRGESKNIKEDRKCH